MKILVKNVNILTNDKDDNIIKDGYIAIEDRKFLKVSSDPEQVKDFQAEKVIDGKGKLAMPGLVNAHTHCAMTFLRNYANDLALEDWLFNNIFPAEAKINAEDVYWGTMLGAAEMIKSGTTSMADMYLFMEGAAEAYEQSGMRVNMSISPLRYDAGIGGMINEKEYFDKLYKKYNYFDEGRLKVYVQVHSAYLWNAGQLKEAAGLAKQLKTGIHIHILETAFEREDTIKKYGKNAAEACAEFGIFDVPVIAAHCVHLSDSDLDLLKKYNVNVAHNPTSNLKLGSGIARVPDMLKWGINVGLGTDGTASNNNLDMFEEMNLSALIHKGAAMNPTLVSAKEAVKMATVNGAKAIGMPETGSIEEGKRADMILINTDNIHFWPMNDIYAALAYTAHGSDVDTTIIDGNVLMEGRQLLNIDEELLKHKVAEISKRIIC